MAQKTQLSQKEREIQQENLLIAIDQLEQITEVMSEVLGKIKKQVVSLESKAPPSSPNKNISKKRTNKSKKINVVH